MLDEFSWNYCVYQRCIAPVLHLRYQVPAAGTAALHAKAGWEDAKHIYGRVIRNQDVSEEKLNKLLQQVKINVGLTLSTENSMVNQESD